MGTKIIDKAIILNALRFLEQSGSVNETAERYKVSRITIYNWRNRYGKEYEEKRKEIQDLAVTVQAKKLELCTGTNELTNKTIKLFEEIIDFFVDDFENFEKLGGKDKISLLNTILPYILEKKAVMPVNPKDPTGVNTQNNFFLGIIEQMKNGDSEDKIQRNIEAITISSDS